jgi:hypothetical protein
MLPSGAIARLPDFDRKLFQRIQAKQNRDWWLWRALVPATACLALATLFLLKQPDSMSMPFSATTRGADRSQWSTRWTTWIC